MRSKFRTAMMLLAAAGLCGALCSRPVHAVAEETTAQTAAEVDAEAPSVAVSQTQEEQAPAAGAPHRPLIYVGPWGSFHLGSAQNLTRSRGIFRLPYVYGTSTWANSLQRYWEDSRYWYYYATGTQITFAFAKYPNPCWHGQYDVWVREWPRRWAHVQSAARSFPEGDLQ